MRIREVGKDLLDVADEEQAERNLRDIGRINRWLGGHRIVRDLVGEVFSEGESFTVLDVGAASGDMGQAVRSRFPGARVVSLDYRMRNLAAAPGPCLVGDAFRLPMREQSIDVVMCSLFLHHFSDEEAVELLERFRRVARRAVVVIDLERHAVARRFLPMTRWLFGWDPLTVHDGMVSVASGFRVKELESLARRAGLRHAVVRGHRPWFRLSLVSINGG
jgi:ubiquinone/menaquinone biosynthesis C-methylase UbiE